MAEDSQVQSMNEITLLQQCAQESVGYITITDETEEIVEYTGTGFRVGNSYFMTAYEVLRDKIDKLIDIIIYCTREVSPNLLQRLELNNETLEITKEKAIRSFIEKNGVDIPLLLDCLGATVKNDVSFVMSGQWEKYCIIDFVNGEKFTVGWNIPFGLENNDIVVLPLIKTYDKQRMPNPLFLEDRFKENDQAYLVSYIKEDHPKIILGTKCHIFTNDGQLAQEVHSANQWMRSLFPEEADKIYYDEPLKAYDKETGQVILKKGSFLCESVGSPIVYAKKRKPFVGMLYQGGYPTFYHSRDESYKMRNKAKRKIDNCVLFAKCITMETLAKILTGLQKTDLKQNIFSEMSMAQHVTENTVVQMSSMAIENGVIQQLESIIETHFKTKGSKYKDNILLIAAAKGSAEICSFLLQQGFPIDTNMIYEEISEILFGNAAIHKLSPLSIAVQFKKIENIKILLSSASDSDIENVDQQDQEIEIVFLEEIRKRLEVKYKGKSLGVVAGFRKGQGVLIVYKDSLEIDVLEEKEQRICGRIFFYKNPKMIPPSTSVANTPGCLLSKSQIKIACRIIDENAPTLWSLHSNLNIITMQVLPEEDRITGLPDYCIVLACTSKGIIPLHQNEFPKELSTNDKTQTLPVHVEEGFYQMCPSYVTTQSKAFHEDLKMGCSISPLDINSGRKVPTGSVGPFIDINGQPGFLTCAHVLYDDPTSAQLQPYIEVLQPESGSFSKNTTPFQCASEPCGKVFKAIFNPQFDISVDAAAVLITDKRTPKAGRFAVDSEEKYKELGFDELPEFNSGCKIDPLNMSTNRVVVKCGKETHLTQGIVRSWGSQVRSMTYSDRLYDKHIEFKNQIEVSNVDPYVFVLPGDSGSAVFQVDDDKSLECIGMAIGTTRGSSINATIVTPISAILQAIGPGISLKSFP